MCGVPEKEQHRGRHIYLSGKDGEMEGAHQKENSNVRLVIMHYFQMSQMLGIVLYSIHYMYWRNDNEKVNRLAIVKIYLSHDQKWI